MLAQHLKTQHTPGGDAERVSDFNWGLSKRAPHVNTTLGQFRQVPTKDFPGWTIQGQVAHNTPTS